MSFIYKINISDGKLTPVSGWFAVGILAHILCHILGAGAPAKTKNYVNADAFIFFREKVRPFPHLAKPVNTILRKVEKAMVQIKREWFDTALKNYERGETHGRWKEKIQV